MSIVRRCVVLRTAGAGARLRARRLNFAIAGSRCPCAFFRVPINRMEVIWSYWNCMNKWIERDADE